MKNLFLYYVKKRFLLLTIVIAMALITSVVVSLSYNMLLPTENGIIISYSYLGYLTTIMCIFATLIPIYEFSFKMHKNSVDLFYSLPIKRYKLYLVKYLIGLLELFIIFTVCFLYIFLYATAHLIDIQSSAKLIYYLYFYLLALGFGALLYNWIVFFFTRANTIIDGIIITILSVFSIVLIHGLIAGIAELIDNTYHWKDDIIYTPYSSIILFTQLFNSKIHELHPNNFFFNKVTFSAITMSIIEATFIPLFFILNNKKKAEDTSDISNEWYTYKLFIPLYVVCMCELVTPADNIDIVYFALIIIGGYILYVIYNRTFKIKKIDLIVLLSTATFGIILTIVLRSILKGYVISLF